MNTLFTLIRPACLACAAVVCLAPGAYGFRGDEKPVPATDISQPATKPLLARALSVQQVSVAAKAQSAGLDIEWNPTLGTPLSIRGADLGQRQAFSAGKGLT